MASPSYLREERFDTLPSINRRQWEKHRKTTYLDNGYLDDRNVRFSPSVPGAHDRHRRVGAIDDMNLDDRNLYGVGQSSRFDERDALFYPRPPSPSHHSQSKKHTLELEDQVRCFRNEINKKDRLISQLTSVDTPRQRGYDYTKGDEFFTGERIPGSTAAKTEIAALQVKVDGLHSQLREMERQLENREVQIRELKNQVETSRENEAKQTAIAHSYREKLVQYETKYDSIEGAASRSEIAINSLQRQNKEYQEKVLELESRVRTHMEEREKSEQERDSVTKKLSDIMNQMGSIMPADDFTSFTTASSIDVFTSRMTEVIQENNMLRGKIASMKEYLSTAELETKASRETIMRLVSEAEREQRSVSQYNVEVDNLRVERDNAVARNRELEREIDLLKERMDATEQAWSATKRELEEREIRYSSIDNEIKSGEAMIRNAEMSYKSFKESLASMLSDGFQRVEPYEESIRDCLKNMLLTIRDKSSHVDLLDSKVAEATNQLEAQYELQRSADRRAKKAEAHVLEMEDRLRRADSELAASDVLRDGLRTDKERYLHFLERVTRAMDMDPIAADMGIDMATDAVIARAQQLLKREGDCLVDRKTHIYNLQRKIKSLKEQLDSKDLHMDLLRKKVAAMDERLLGKSGMEREKDDEFIKNRKLLKLVEKYKRELNEARIEIRDLKARLLESSDIKARAFEQEREIESLESTLGKLEQVRVSQAHKISGLKGEVDIREQTLDQKREQTSNTIQALSSELRTTKAALEECQKRERQLLDLRQVLARMLGMDVNVLAVPDYEIIARLEKLILANQANASTAVVLDSALEDMEDGFRAGYDDATQALAIPPRSHNPMRRSLRTRSRSMSPTRRRDTRAY